MAAARNVGNSMEGGSALSPLTPKLRMNGIQFVFPDDTSETTHNTAEEASPLLLRSRDGSGPTNSEEASSAPASPATPRLQKVLNNASSLRQTWREKGTRAFLQQLCVLVLYLVLGLAAPVCGWVWDLLQGHKAKQSKKMMQQRIRMSMESAESFAEYLKYAKCLDEMSGYNEWADSDEGTYNSKLLVERIDRMRELLANGDVHGCMAEVRSGLHRHIAGVTNPELFVFLAGTKSLINDYHCCVADMCDLIIRSPDVHPTEKYTCFEHSARSFGRSALLLSGGGALGLYHTGVCKALFEAGVMPGVISGASAGAIIASIFCTKTDDELSNLIEHELNDATNTSFESFSLDAFDSDVFSNQKGFATAVNRLVSEGAFMSSDSLVRTLRQNIGDVTFGEAFEKTGRVLNIAVAYSSAADTHSLQLNHITSPQVVVWSAVAASCSVPGLFSKTELFCKDTSDNLLPFNPGHGCRYFDGSIAADIPIKRLRELFNIGFTVVSQTNPHVVPFLQRERFVKPHQATGPPRRLRNAVVWAARYMLGEVGHVALVVGRLFPRFSKSTLYRLLDQYYTGDITVYPGVAWLDYLGLVLNPSRTFVRHALTRGQRKTWPHLNRVSQCMVVEVLLRKSKARVRDLLSQSWLRELHAAGAAIRDSPAPLSVAPSPATATATAAAAAAEEEEVTVAAARAAAAAAASSSPFPCSPSGFCNVQRAPSPRECNGSRPRTVAP